MRDMTLTRRPRPFAEFLTLRPTFDRLLDDAFVDPRRWAFPFGTADALPLDIRSAPDALVVDAALPGIRPEDVEITVEDRTLTIRAESRDERQEEQGETLVSEIRRGAVRRTITLPRGLETDKATATFENGVLHLSIPRADEVKPRQIQITPTIDADATSHDDATNAKPVDAGAVAEA
jgi:HSP20 family protein